MRILIAEDEPVTRELFAHLLRKLGHEALLYPGGAEACAAIRGGLTPDAVWTDIMMPEVDGFQVLRTVRNLLPEVPVMIVSAYGDASVVLEALRGGAMYFLMKPFTLAELQPALRRIEDWVTERRQATALLKTMAECRMKFRLPPDLGTVQPLAARLRLCAEPVLGAEGALAFQVAAVELLSNAIEHGSLEISRSEKGAALAEGAYEALLAARRQQPSFATRAVTVDFVARAGDGAELIVMDEGPGFDPAAQPDPLARENLLALNGRGILVARMQVDALEYDNGGRTVRIRKDAPEE